MVKLMEQIQLDPWWGLILWCCGLTLLQTFIQMAILQIMGLYHWKYPMSNSSSMHGFWHWCADTREPNIEIEMMRPYHSVQMRHVMASSFWFQCLVSVFFKRYIEVEFNVRYFQWYVSKRFFPVQVSISFKSEAAAWNDIDSLGVNRWRWIKRSFLEIKIEKPEKQNTLILVFRWISSQSICLTATIIILSWLES